MEDPLEALVFSPCSFGQQGPHGCNMMQSNWWNDDASPEEKARFHFPVELASGVDDMIEYLQETDKVIGLAQVALVLTSTLKHNICNTCIEPGDTRIAILERLLAPHGVDDLQWGNEDMSAIGLEVVMDNDTTDAGAAGQRGQDGSGQAAGQVDASEGKDPGGPGSVNVKCVV